MKVPGRLPIFIFSNFLFVGCAVKNDKPFSLAKNDSIAPPLRIVAGDPVVKILQ